jgi:hypothetical protein
MNPGFHYLLSLPSRPLSYLTQYITFLVVWWAGFPLELPIHSNLDDYFPLKNTLNGRRIWFCCEVCHVGTLYRRCCV